MGRRKRGRDRELKENMLEADKTAGEKLPSFMAVPSCAPAGRKDKVEIKSSGTCCSSRLGKKLPMYGYG